MDLLDANIFIEARKRYYAFDICPGYWKSLLAKNQAGAVCSLDQVKVELVGIGDELSEWATVTVPAAFFHDSSAAAVVARYGDIMAWVNDQAQFSAAAKAEFAAGADGWLIAYATVHGHRIITEEVFNADIKKRVPIPNVCNAFGVPYVNTWAMLRDQGITFDWIPPAAAAAAGVAPAAGAGVGAGAAAVP